MSGRPGHRDRVLITQKDLAWQARAHCKGVSPGLFFPTKGHGATSGQAAARICQRCDVELQCLQYALAHPDGNHGIWGGATEAERRKLRKGRAA